MIRSNARLGACCLTQCKRVSCPLGRELTCLVSVMIRNWTLPLELTCHRFAATLEGLDLTMVGLIRKEYRSENASTWEPMPSWRGSYAAWGGERGTGNNTSSWGEAGGHICTPPPTTDTQFAHYSAGAVLVVSTRHQFQVTPWLKIRENSCAVLSGELGYLSQRWGGGPWWG